MGDSALQATSILFTTKLAAAQAIPASRDPQSNRRWRRRLPNEASIRISRSGGPATVPALTRSLRSARPTFHREAAAASKGSR